MATTVTLHPNSTVSNAGFVVTGASLHAALADPSGANYVTGSGAVADSWRTGVETYVLAADERVNRIRTILNCAKSTGAVELNVDYGAGAFRSVTSSAVGVLTLTGSWQTPSIGVGAAGLTQAEVDALEMYCNASYGGGADYNQQYEARMQLEIIKQPTATFSAASYALRRDVIAVLPWTYNGFGESQTKYMARVFLASDVALGGFDPDVNVPVWDSGLVSSSSTFVAATGLAYDTEYVVFVKVAKAFHVPGSLTYDWFSEWAESPPWFTIGTPLATAILPNSPALTTNKPLVSWVMEPSAADEEPDPVQQSFQVKIFEVPGGGWGGFDPDTNTADLVEDSGQIVSAATSWQSTVALANNLEHRVYVKLWRTSGSLTPHVEGAWANQGFTTDFIAPATPSIVTAIQANGVDVGVTVTPGLKNLVNANQSSLESNIFGYATTGNATQAHEAVIAAHGTKSLAVTKTVGAGTIDTEMQAEVPCTAGLTYTAQVSVRKAAGNTARAVRIGLRWYAAGDVLLGTDWGAASNDTDAFAVRSVTAVAPPTAVEMTVAFEVAAMGLGEIRYYDKIMIQQTNVVNTWFSGGTPEETHYSVQRRCDGGEWEFFQLGGDVSSERFPVPGEPFTVYDREGCLGKLNEYRAAAIGTALSIETQSTWSVVDSETLLKQEVWIKDLYDPDLNRHYYVGDKWLYRQKRKARMVQRPLGRTNPIVVKGGGGDSAFTITFIVLGEDDYDNLMRMIDEEHTLFLQTPKGNWTVEISGDVSIREHLWDKKKTLPSGATEEDVWQVVMPVQEVDI